MRQCRFIWIATLLFSGSSVNAQIAYEEDLYAITNEILRLIDFPGNAMKDLQRHRHRTDDEMAEELMFVCNALAGNDEMFSARVNAFDYLGDFPSTNAIQFLQTTFKSEENSCGIRALVSYIRLLNYSKEGLAVIDSFFDDNTYDGFRLDTYSQLNNQLKYWNPPQETRERIVSFIRRRAGKGDIYGTWLDDILCQHLEGYAASDERRRNLRLLLDNPMAFESTIERAKARLADMDRHQEKGQSNISDEMPPQEEEKTIEDAASTASVEPSITEKPISENALNDLPSRQPQIRTAINRFITIVLVFCILGLLFFHRK